MSNLKQYILDNYSAQVAAQDYRAIADALNAPTTIDNPSERGDVPLPIALKSVMSLVQPAEMVAVYKELPAFVADLKKAIDDQDREYMAGLLAIAATAGVVGAETISKLQALLATTVPDPSWTATIPGPSIAVANGWSVTEHTVQALLNQD